MKSGQKPQDDKKIPTISTATIQPKSAPIKETPKPQPCRFYSKSWSNPDCKATVRKKSRNAPT